MPAKAMHCLRCGIPRDDRFKLGRCPPCYRIRVHEKRESRLEKARASCRAWKKAYPERARANYRRWHLRAKYGLTMTSFQQMVDAQGNVCAICQEPFVSTPKVDHCHGTGRVRGLLCHQCNVGLGAFRDNCRSLERAIRYLTRLLSKWPCFALKAVNIWISLNIARSIWHEGSMGDGC